MLGNGRNFKCGLLFILLCLVCLPKLEAHFIWVYSEDGEIKVVFGEGLEPDQAQFLSGLSGMKAYAQREDGYKLIELSKQTDGDEGWFEVSAEDAGPVVEVACAYGVFGRGDEKMFLDYSAKYIALPTTAGKRLSESPSSKLALDLVPVMDAGRLQLMAYFNGKPTEGVEVQLESVDADSITRSTDSSGNVSLGTATRYVVRAKYVVDEAGEIDGEKFSERRYYCTLVLDLPATESENTGMKAGKPSGVQLQIADLELPELPQGMTSFGATRMGQYLYVIGGKSGKAHAYATSYQNRNVYRLDLDRPDAGWETVADNLGLQGLAVIGHNEKIYRIGGLEARNKEGEEQDLHSTRAFVVFDPEKKTWSEMPMLPAGRSSLDACVAGDQLFVVGGWKLAGEQDAEWCQEMLRFDFSDPESGWQKIPAPFNTRALAVCSHQGKLVVVGGIKKEGGLSNDVYLFDLETKEWTVGPEIPVEGNMKAFGCSAISLGDHLLVSTYDGGIYRLASSSSAGDELCWEKIHQLDIGRFFHQMLPVNERCFALIGGAHMEYGSFTEVEAYEIVDVAAKKIVEH